MIYDAESKKRYTAWIDDIEYRCFVHLLEHPETDQKQLPVLASIGNAMSPGTNPRVEVREGKFPNMWEVWLDGKITTTWMGYTAHADATKYAADLVTRTADNRWSWPTDDMYHKCRVAGLDILLQMQGYLPIPQTQVQTDFLIMLSERIEKLKND